jgi:hypothetical protein
MDSNIIYVTSVSAWKNEKKMAVFSSRKKAQRWLECQIKDHPRMGDWEKREKDHPTACMMYFSENESVGRKVKAGEIRVAANGNKINLERMEELTDAIGPEAL